MESEMASSTDEQQVAGSAANTRGKHRVLAKLKRVEQESRFLEEEMEELEKTDNVSALCEELVLSMETIIDPLLLLTNGPINPSWDRWFEGPQGHQGCSVTEGERDEMLLGSLQKRERRGTKCHTFGRTRSITVRQFSGKNAARPCGKEWLKKGANPGA
ncbi:hypothetical protein REPUB_Repub04eG0124300 [Reevesia pubescens]